MKKVFGKSHWSLPMAQWFLLIGSVAIGAEPQLKPRFENLKVAPGQPSLPQRVTANKPVQGEIATQNADKVIATCLAIGNEEEVKLAELAKDQAKNKKVREFAEMMIKDHSAMLAKLQPFGTEPTLAGKETAAPLPQSGGIDFIAAKRQMAQMCLENAQKCWQDKSKSEAEMAYVGQQIVMHAQMIVAQKVLRQHASPELQALLDKGIETAEEHQQHAEELILDLDEDQSSDSN